MDWWAARIRTNEGQWSYVRTKTATCDRSLFFPQGNTGNQVTGISPDYDDQYYCFKFVYDNQKAYLSVKIDWLKVSLAQTGQVLTATANKTDVTWAYKRSDSRPDCSQLTYSGANSGTTNTLTLSSTDKHKYYCFKGTKSNQVDYAYKKITKTDPLNIDIIHDQDTLTAKADLTGVTWRYARTENSQNCTTLTYISTNNTNVISLTPDDLWSLLLLQSHQGQPDRLCQDLHQTK